MAGGERVDAADARDHAPHQLARRVGVDQLVDDRERALVQPGVAPYEEPADLPGAEVPADGLRPLLPALLPPAATASG